MQFRDLNAQYLRLKTEIDEGIMSVITGGQFILGPQVDQLEKELAAYVGTKRCISCANGTDALQLVLMAWGIGPGDAVFTSDFTFFASAGCASIVGATPVFVDIDERTFNLSPDDLERRIVDTLKQGKLTPKVIIPVDLFGQPADYDAILSLAKRYGLRVLEDGAQGFGGSIRGKRVCSFGDAATTSFFPAKPFGCYGDGGAIFTDDAELSVLLRSLRAQGRSPSDKYDNRLIGMNSRLDTLQAAILLPKLKAFQSFELDAVNRAARRYTELLENHVVTPYVPSGYVSSWAQYTIRLKDEEERNALQAALKTEGIPSMVYYPRGLHSQSAYRELALEDGDYPCTARAARTVLSLPMHPDLTNQDIERVANCILMALK